MDQHILNQLLEAALEMKNDVATIKERQDRTIQDHDDTRTSLNVINSRLSVVESKVSEAAMTWKITKRIVVGLITVAVSLITFNWAGLKAAWVLLLHG